MDKKKSFLHMLTAPLQPFNNGHQETAVFCAVTFVATTTDSCRTLSCILKIKNSALYIIL